MRCRALQTTSPCRPAQTRLSKADSSQLPQAGHRARLALLSTRQHRRHRHRPTNPPKCVRLSAPSPSTTWPAPRRTSQCCSRWAHSTSKVCLPLVHLASFPCSLCTEGDNSDRPTASEIRTAYFDAISEEPFRETHAFAFDDEGIKVFDSAVLSAQKNVRSRTFLDST